MTVSIIIAAKTWQENLRECVDKCGQLDFPGLEIIVLPDASIAQQLGERVRVIPTGPVSPPRKRDIGIREARGDIIAFLDDDAYPSAGWLASAAVHFKDASVAAVGGPAVTPGSDDLRQQASGLVYSNPLVSGGFAYRYLPKRQRLVDDYPSCNLLVRTSVLRDLGGFNTDFWPGEDTKLCLDITRKLGKKIVYDPKVLVYHHRRRLYVPHLRQIANYALHRGYFVKRFPQTSLRPSYFIPSLFLLCLFSGLALSIFLSWARPLYLAGFGLYAALVFSFALSAGPRLVFPVFFGIVLTHLAYGYFFIKGLLKNRLKEEQ